ncbi:bifunctional peptidase and (3S)-lysyl hydroxylase JMJD7 isoform X1 [Diachasmimorpha longicaudata]|uniref:bifunctional peptidase and (3S)-lysyl hydroxylase JMJD7 isoform X1 n=1 Tax=Diachasmimorpha longicaudata TaxID=58733 RepID=UPI0030B8D1A8
MERTSKDLVDNYCRVISQEARELYLKEEIDTIDAKSESLSPLHFHQKYLSKNLPLLIKNGVSNWPAVGKWGIDHFRRKIPEKRISVAVTPNGYADAVATNEEDNREYFVMPEEREMTMSEFLDTLTTPRDDAVLYIQKQNSNFQEEFHELWRDVEEPKWISEAFGKQPDAINFWMGDQRAVTSMHKDPYENIYCVVSGEKEFILHPPTDLPWIPYGKYPSGIYRRAETSWKIEPLRQNPSQVSEEGELLPWIAVDPLKPDYTRYPMYENATTIKVSVQAGDILYLPSLWFHHVQQSQACIAINFWYDMEYDIKYVYFKGLEMLTQ